MQRLSSSLLLTAVLTLFSTALLAANPQAVIHTSRGDITLELFADKSPKTVANFIQYANDGFYNGTVFHRIVRRFVVQGGGFTQDLVKKETRDPIPNESDNGLHNERGTVAMARSEDPHSATSQFFFNLKMNAKLDYQYKTLGYTVFAKVIDGMHVVKELGRIPSRPQGIHPNLPKTLVTIDSIEIIDQ